jgi:hypothetical protein
MTTVSPSGYQSRNSHGFRNYGQNEFFLTDDAAFRIVYVSERKHRPMADGNALHPSR